MAKKVNAPLDFTPETTSLNPVGRDVKAEQASKQGQLNRDAIREEGEAAKAAEATRLRESQEREERQQIRDRQEADRKAEMQTPLTPAERDELGRLEIIAEGNSGQKSGQVPRETMLRLRDLRERANYHA